MLTDVKQPPHVLEEKINDLHIRLVGVIHTDEYFKEHEQFFKNEVQHTNTLFLEDGVTFIHTKFYRNIADLTKETTKQIYVPDDANVALLPLLEFAQFALGVVIIGKSSERIAQPMSRRGFLKQLGKSFLGLHLVTGFLGTRQDLLQKWCDENTVIDDALDYGTILDFRNLVSAGNLIRAQTELGLTGTASYIIGASHIRGISAYLRNPLLRTKRIVYIPQYLLMNTRIKEYKFIENEWRIAREF